MEVEERSEILGGEVDLGIGGSLSLEWPLEISAVDQN